MELYSSLLVNAGGGVIDHTKQSDRQPGATVIIDLGGTGKDAVIRLKKEVYRQLKPDDVDAEIPKYKDIRYLIIDSDDWRPGRHLYEHGEVNWNEWLPSPVPASFRAGIPP